LARQLASQDLDSRHGTASGLVVDELDLGVVGQLAKLTSLARFMSGWPFTVDRDGEDLTAMR